MNADRGDIFQLVTARCADAPVEKTFTIPLTSTAPKSFDSAYQGSLPSDVDIIKYLYLQVSVQLPPAVAAHYRWKRWWPLLLLKELQLQINDHEFLQSNQDWDFMRYFMLPLDKHYCNVFGDDKETRTQLSKAKIEATIPLPLLPSSFFAHTLQYVKNSIFFRVVPWQTLVEPIDAAVETSMLLSQQTVPLDMDLRGLGNCLQRHRRFNSSITFIQLTPQYQTKTIRALKQSSVSLRIAHDNFFCEHVYLWVRRPDNSEFAQPVVASLTVVLNGHYVREKMAGHEARHLMQTRLGHETNLCAVELQNLYFLSYTDGTVENFAPRFEEFPITTHVNYLNLTATKSYEIRLTLLTEAIDVDTIAITVGHRFINEWKGYNGLFGSCYKMEAMEIIVTK